MGDVVLCTQIYKYRDLTARDITNATSHYKDIKPVMDNYGKTSSASKLQPHFFLFKHNCITKNKNRSVWTLCGCHKLEYFVNVSAV